VRTKAKVARESTGINARKTEYRAGLGGVQENAVFHRDEEVIS